MFELLTDPIFWGALMALLGVVVGQLVGGWGKKKDHDLAAIQLTVEVLSGEVERLTSEVKELRSKWDHTEKRYRILTEKFSAAMAWISAARVWECTVRPVLEQVGARYAPLPPVPESIAADVPTTPAPPRE